jgi:hypothetical protein
MSISRKYGLKFEERKYKTYSYIPSMYSLPSKIDLSSKFPDCYDQGQIGSCTANSLVAAYQYLTPNQFMGSRLFLYYNERMLDGDISEDAGSTLSQGINALKTLGLCSEEHWDYNPEHFKATPIASCYIEAKTHKVVKADPINLDLISMKTCLSSNLPIVIGIAVYQSFEGEDVAKTGIVPMPKSDETPKEFLNLEILGELNGEIMDMVIFLIHISKMNIWLRIYGRLK